MTVKNKASTFLTDRLEVLNDLISNVGIEQAIKTARSKGLKSARELRRTVDGLVRKSAVRNVNTITKEIRRISKDLTSRVRNAESVVGETLTRLQDSEVLGYAIHRINDTRSQVLSALQIPSTSDVDELSRKLAVLEKKIDHLKKIDLRH